MQIKKKNLNILFKNAKFSLGKVKQEVCILNSYKLSLLKKGKRLSFAALRHIMNEW